MAEQELVQVLVDVQTLIEKDAEINRLRSQLQDIISDRARLVGFFRRAKALIDDDAPVEELRQLIQRCGCYQESD